VRNEGQGAGGREQKAESRKQKKTSLKIENAKYTK
jgi:hypothetical protein